ncbi:MAG: DPP IV N-terminal domain-containing protein [bacterium]
MKAAALIAALCCVVSGIAIQPSSLVAYELKGHIVIADQPVGPRPLPQPIGEAPSFSPKGDLVAFLRGGNVWLIQVADGQVKQLTHDPVLSHQYMFYEPSITWSNSGDKLFYTRNRPYQYHRQKKGLAPASDNDKADWIGAIWMAEVKTGKSKQLLGPKGNFRYLKSMWALFFTSVYAPLLSPDQSSLWFVNVGSLYEVPIDLAKMEVVGKQRLITLQGSLDLDSTRASHASMGIRELVWDSANSRLCWWFERFGGTGFSSYGYISWKDGSWGKAYKWHPKFSREIQEAGDVNTNDAVFDSAGKLWVSAYNQKRMSYSWVRQDGLDHLPVGADNPTWPRNLER